MEPTPESPAARPPTERRLRDRGLQVGAAVRLVGVVGGIVLIARMASPLSPFGASTSIAALVVSGALSSAISLRAVRPSSTWRGSKIGLVHVVLDLVNMLLVAITVDPTAETGAWALALVPIGQAAAVLSVRHALVAWATSVAVVGGVALGTADRTAGEHVGAIALLMFFSFGPTSVYLVMSGLMRGALRRSWTAREELRRQASTDSLTGLLNRRGIEREATTSWPADGATVLFCDLDGFKSVNDCFGHEAGDDVLRQVARRLEASDHLAARLAGDEFVVVVPTVDPAAVSATAARLRATICDEPFEVRGDSVSVGVSIGTATARRADDFWATVDSADAEMYLDKPPRAADAIASRSAPGAAVTARR